MLAAGNQNPDVRLTGSAAPKSGATVKVDAEIENEEDVLREVRAIRLGPFVPPKQKHSTHAPGPAQIPLPGAADASRAAHDQEADPTWSLSPAKTKTSHARVPGAQPGPSPGRNKNIPRTRQAQPRSLRPANTKTSLARPPATVARVPSTPFQSARRSPPQRLPACLHSPRFALDQSQNLPPRRTAGGSKNEIQVDCKVSARLFTSRGYKQPFQRIRLEVTN